MDLKSDGIVASGEWKLGDSPMKRIRDNPELLASFAATLEAINERQRLAEKLANQTEFDPPS